MTFETLTMNNKLTLKTLLSQMNSSGSLFIKEEVPTPPAKFSSVHSKGAHWIKIYSFDSDFVCQKPLI